MNRQWGIQVVMIMIQMSKSKLEVTEAGSFEEPLVVLVRVLKGK